MVDGGMFLDNYGKRMLTLDGSRRLSNGAGDKCKCDVVASTTCNGGYQSHLTKHILADELPEDVMYLGYLNGSDDVISNHKFDKSLPRVEAWQACTNSVFADYREIYNWEQNGQMFCGECGSYPGPRYEKQMETIRVSISNVVWNTMPEMDALDGGSYWAGWGFDSSWVNTWSFYSFIFWQHDGGTLGGTFDCSLFTSLPRKYKAGNGPYPPATSNVNYHVEPWDIWHTGVCTYGAYISSPQYRRVRYNEDTVFEPAFWTLPSAPFGTRYDYAAYNKMALTIDAHEANNKTYVNLDVVWGGDGAADAMFIQAELPFFSPRDLSSLPVSGSWYNVERTYLQPRYAIRSADITISAV